MMKRIAKKTTIHGIKEAVYANRIGRTFFGITFIACAVLMFFQLKSLFQAYINESVGTRVTIPTAGDEVEAASFYYCNDMWFPNMMGLKELNSSGHGNPRRMYDEAFALHINVLRQNNAVHPLDNFWWKMRMQDLINGIMLLPEKGRFDRLLISMLRPKEGSDDFYNRAHHEMIKILNGIVGSSLHKIIEKNLGESMTHEDSLPVSLLMNKTHGIFPTAFPDPTILTADEFESSLSDRAGIPKLTLDGICWEFSPEPIGQKAKQPRSKIHRHVVTHFGGLGRQFSQLLRLYLTTYGSTEMRNGDTLVSAMDRIIGDVVAYAKLYTSMYATYVAIAVKGHPHLLFDQKTLIDSWAPRVRLNYWTRRTVHKSRSGWPCGSEAWTDLDQAHCNQRYAKERRGLACAQYLPASSHFNETGITNETCIYDHTGLFEMGKSAAAKQSVGSPASFPLRISSASRQDVLFNLTVNSLRCPKSCVKTLFQFETTYPTSEYTMVQDECFLALAYLFVPTEDINEAFLGNYSVRHNDGSSLRPFILERAYEVIRAHPFRDPIIDTYPTREHNYRWPCSVVEFERSETHGQISEEYFLYNLSDMAANVGGTMGLWMGASVISFVQLIYLCCLKRLFKRLHRYRSSHLTRCPRRLRITVMKQKVGTGRTRQKNAQTRCILRSKLMNDIAYDSTIHGIKDASNANWIGRIFFAIVFITCTVFMFLQLKGVLRDYVNDSVGTRLTDVTEVEVVEIPSFSYCNDIWFPNLQGLKELNRNGMPMNLSEQIVAYHHASVLRKNDTVHPVDNLWRLMRMQDLVNGIMMLPEERRSFKHTITKLNPDRESDGFYIRAHHEMTKMLKGLIGGSLRNAVENKLEGSSSHRNSGINQAHSIFPNMPQLGAFLDGAATRELLSKLSDRNGVLTTSLDGVCWQFSTGPVRQKTQQSIGERHRHVVSHFGGLGRQFSELVYLYLTTRGSSVLHKGDTLSSVLERVVNKVVRYSSYYTELYSTYVSISSQSDPQLLLDQKLHLDSFSPRVLLKYWTKKSVLKSRKGWPCRSDSWTVLDQAHCNQNLAKDRGDFVCKQYLPASIHYRETIITDKTCIYDHTGLIELGAAAEAKRSMGPSEGYPLQISSASRQEVVSNLTANSVFCPMPCSKTSFQFETTYPASDGAAVQCWPALAYLFVPPEDLNVPQVESSTIKLHLFHAALSKIMIPLNSPYSTSAARRYKNSEHWPCSVVEFERSETHGQISEEYFLYSLSDVTANVGGTMGLWIGASIISIVQLIYLCCLKRLFKRVHRCRLRHLTTFVRRLRPVVVTEMMDDRRTRY